MLDYQKPSIDPAVKEALASYVEWRKRVISGKT